MILPGEQRRVAADQANKKIGSGRKAQTHRQLQIVFSGFLKLAGLSLPSIRASFLGLDRGTDDQI
jgi:hypothetical protein